MKLIHGRRRLEGSRPNPRWTLARAASALLLIVGSLVSAAITAAPAQAVTAQSIADLARAQVGNDCSPYTTAGGTSACQNLWCAVFASWVWRTAGVSSAPDTWVATDTATWAIQNGLWKARPTGGEGNPQPGDMVVYGQPGAGPGGHVGVIYSVNDNGTITTVDGDFNGTSPTNSHVFLDTVNPVTATSGENNWPISGYISPPGLTSAPTMRLGVLSGGSAFVKEGGLDGFWGGTPSDLPLSNGDAKVVVSGNWVGALGQNGQLFIKAGGLSAGWSGSEWSAGPVKDFAMDARSGVIAILTTNGSVYVKNGINGAWASDSSGHPIAVATGVSKVVVSGTWIGVMESGSLFIKDVGAGNNWSASWSPSVSNGISDFSMDSASGYVGVVAGGQDFVKNSSGDNWSAPWSPVLGQGVTKLVISGTWIGQMSQSGVLSVKDAGVSFSAPWHNEMSGVSDFALDAHDGLVACVSNGVASAKAGGLDGNWDTELSGSAQQVSLSDY